MLLVACTSTYSRICAGIIGIDSPSSGTSAQSGIDVPLSAIGDPTKSRCGPPTEIHCPNWQVEYNE